MPVYRLGDKKPRIHPTTFVHPLASVIGDVVLGPGCYVGPGASLRGDWVSIRVGAGANIQDSCAVHGFPGVEVVLEEDSHLGHGCIIHGAGVGRDVLVGMNAVVQDEVVLGEGCIVGAGCVVAHGTVVPPRKLVVGVPGKVVEDVSPEMRDRKREGTRWYQDLARECLSGFGELSREEYVDENVESH